jgi:hypothetical protein
MQEDVTLRIGADASPLIGEVDKAEQYLANVKVKAIEIAAKLNTEDLNRQADEAAQKFRSTLDAAFKSIRAPALSRNFASGLGFDSIAKEIDRVGEQLDKLQSRANAFRFPVIGKGAIQELGNQVKEYQASIKNAETTVEQFATSINKIRYGAVDRAITARQKEVDTLTGQLDRLNEKITARGDKGPTDIQANNLRDYQQRVEAATASLKELQATQKTINKVGASILNEKNEDPTIFLEKRIESLRSFIAKYKKELAGINSQVENNQEGSATPGQSRNIDILVSRIETLSKKTKEAQSLLSTLNNIDTSNLTATDQKRIQSLREQIEQTKGSIKEFQEAINANKVDTSGLQKLEQAVRQVAEAGKLPGSKSQIREQLATIEQYIETVERIPKNQDSIEKALIARGRAVNALSQDTLEYAKALEILYTQESKAPRGGTEFRGAQSLIAEFPDVDSLPKTLNELSVVRGEVQDALNNVPLDSPLQGGLKSILTNANDLIKYLNPEGVRAAQADIDEALNFGKQAIKDYVKEIINLKATTNLDITLDDWSSAFEREQAALNKSLDDREAWFAKQKALDDKIFQELSQSKVDEAFRNRGGEFGPDLVFSPERDTRNEALLDRLNQSGAPETKRAEANANNFLNSLRTDNLTNFNADLKEFARRFGESKGGIDQAISALKALGNSATVEGEKLNAVKEVLRELQLRSGSLKLDPIAPGSQLVVRDDAFAQRQIEAENRRKLARQAEIEALSQTKGNVNLFTDKRSTEAITREEQSRIENLKSIAAIRQQIIEGYKSEFASVNQVNAALRDAQEILGNTKTNSRDFGKNAFNVFTQQQKAFDKSFDIEAAISGEIIPEDAIRRAEQLRDRAGDTPALVKLAAQEVQNLVSRFSASSDAAERLNKILGEINGKAKEINLFDSTDLNTLDQVGARISEIKKKLNSINASDVDFQPLVSQLNQLQSKQFELSAERTVASQTSVQDSISQGGVQSFIDNTIQQLGGANTPLTASAAISRFKAAKENLPFKSQDVDKLNNAITELEKNLGKTGTTAKNAATKASEAAQDLTAKYLQAKATLDAIATGSVTSFSKISNAAKLVQESLNIEEPTSGIFAQRSFDNLLLDLAKIETKFLSIKAVSDRLAGGRPAGGPTLGFPPPTPPGGSPGGGSGPSGAPPSGGNRGLTELEQQIAKIRQLEFLAGNIPNLLKEVKQAASFELGFLDPATKDAKELSSIIDSIDKKLAKPRVAKFSFNIDDQVKQAQEKLDRANLRLQNAEPGTQAFDRASRLVQGRTDQLAEAQTNRRNSEQRIAELTIQSYGRVDKAGQGLTASLRRVKTAFGDNAEGQAAFIAKLERWINLLPKGTKGLQTLIKELRIAKVEQENLAKVTDIDRVGFGEFGKNVAGILTGRGEQFEGARGVFDIGKRFTVSSPGTQRGINEGLIGGAFPLLFGQGLLPSLGGLVGGTTGGLLSQGGGFAGGLIGTAALQGLADASAAATNLAEAMKDPINNFEQLKTSLALSSKAVENFVDSLIQRGKPLEARAAIAEDLAKNNPQLLLQSQEENPLGTETSDLGRRGAAKLNRSIGAPVAQLGNLALAGLGAFDAGLEAISFAVVDAFAFVLTRGDKKFGDAAKLIRSAADKVAERAKKFADEEKGLYERSLEAIRQVGATPTGLESSVQARTTRSNTLDNFTRPLQGLRGAIAQTADGPTRVKLEGELAKLLEDQTRSKTEALGVSQGIASESRYQLQLQQRLNQVGPGARSEVGQVLEENRKLEDAANNRVEAEQKINTLKKERESGVLTDARKKELDLLIQDEETILNTLEAQTNEVNKAAAIRLQASKDALRDAQDEFRLFNNTRGTSGVEFESRTELERIRVAKRDFESLSRQAQATGDPALQNRAEIAGLNLRKAEIEFSDNISKASIQAGQNFAKVAASEFQVKLAQLDFQKIRINTERIDANRRDIENTNPQAAGLSTRIDANNLIASANTAIADSGIKLDDAKQSLLESSVNLKNIQTELRQNIVDRAQAGLTGADPNLVARAREAQDINDALSQKVANAGEEFNNTVTQAGNDFSAQIAQSRAQLTQANLGLAGKILETTNPNSPIFGALGGTANQEAASLIDDVFKTAIKSFEGAFGRPYQGNKVFENFNSNSPDFLKQKAAAADALLQISALKENTNALKDVAARLANARDSLPSAQGGGQASNPLGPLAPNIIINGRAYTGGGGIDKPTTYGGDPVSAAYKPSETSTNNNAIVASTGNLIKSFTSLDGTNTELNTTASTLASNIANLVAKEWAVNVVVNGKTLTVSQPGGPGGVG